MNDQSYFHWDLFRPAIHSPSFAMGGSFLDIRDDPMRVMQGKAACKPFSLDQSCAFWSKEIGLEGADGLQNVGGRVLEIRKEKSRDAARSRRGKENYEFYELAKLLPLPAAITSQLDKASIIRLSISYLKLRDFCGHGDPPWNRDGQSINKNIKGQRRSQLELFELHQGAHILQSLDGFAFALSSDGRFIYISETVSIYLGLSQVEMAGSSIFDYIHLQDHQEMADELGLSLASISCTMSSPSSPSAESPTGTRSITPPINDRVPAMTPNVDKSATRSFCIRMKSTLTKRGVHTRTSGYRAVLILGQFRSQMNFAIGRKCAGPLLGLTGVAIALPPPTITELRIEADTFIMRLTSDFKVIYCENVIHTLMDWRSDDISGKDLYIFCHPGDVHLLKKIHKDLLTKGQVLSPSIRLLNKGGGYIWVQVCCTSLFTSKTSDDQTVLAIFQTISIEHRGVVLDTSQLQTPNIPVVSDRPVVLDTSKPEDLELLMRTDDLPKCSPKSAHCLDRIQSQSSRGTPESPEPPPIETNMFTTGMDNDFLLDDTLERDERSFKHDSRLSRRKTDRPRKRKRESNDSPVGLQNVDLPEKSDKIRRNSSVSDRTSVESADDCILNLSSGNQSIPKSPANETATSRLSQQLPEDLSLGTINHKPNLSAFKSDKMHLNGPNNTISSSVHELEKAMSRHLPSRTKGHYLQAQSRSPVEHQWTSPFNHPSTCASFSVPFSASTIHSNRESVIRSSLSNRIHGANGDGIGAPSTSDVTIHKDQLQLHIPHISVHSKHQYNSQKDIVSVTGEFGMTPPSSVSPQDKLVTGTFSDTDINPDCLGMRTAQRLPITSPEKYQFQGISDSTNDMAKQQFLAVPTYQFPTTDVGAFTHPSQQPGGLILDTRLPANGGIWYGTSHPS